MSFLGSEIAKLGFGLMRLPMNGDDIDEQQTQEMVDKFMSAGFTYFDTAYVYIGGKSEEIVSKVLADKYPRDAYQLATKLPIWEVKKKEDMQIILDKELDRTQTGYFDFYLLHALGKQRMDDLDKFDAWQFMVDQKAAGKVKHIGFSFHDNAELLDEILTNHPEMEFVQLQINYVDWEDEDVQSKKCYEVARKHNKPIIIMEPVKGGALASMSPDIQDVFKKAAPEASVASWAMRYTASMEGVITVLSGMSNIEQIEDNVSTIANFKKIDDADMATLETVKTKLAEIPTIPCTNCKYCVDDCPMNIPIPGIFAIANKYKVYGNLESAKGHYKWVTSKGGKASDCIECGLCEGHCPQHIKIIDELKEAADLFE